LELTAQIFHQDVEFLDGCIMLVVNKCDIKNGKNEEIFKSYLSDMEK
jgi:hypothetical protein